MKDLTMKNELGIEVNCKNCKHSYVSEKTGIRRCSIHQCCHGCDKRVSDKEKYKDYKRRSE